MAEHVLLVGDCLEQLAQFPDYTFGALVTDPPAGMDFMGLDWDSSFGDEFAWIDWLAARLREVLRVLKPGAHGAVWAHPTTSWMTGAALRLAGFEIVDTFAHINGQSFPKNGCSSVGIRIDKYLGVASIDAGENPNHRPVSGVKYEGVYAGANTGSSRRKKPASEAGQKWEEYNIALKGAREDWFIVRRPLDGTIAENLLKWGVGAMNVGGCRIATDETLTRKLGKTTESASGWKSVNRAEVAGQDGGRYPSNVAFSHHDDCVELRLGVDQHDWACVPSCVVRQLDSMVPPSRSRRGKPRKSQKPGNGYGMTHTGAEYDDAGGPSRFFFCAKPTKREKGEGTKHQTVKPIALMRYLVRLVTPSGQVVLDPFYGTGTTGIAAAHEDRDCVGIELKHEHVPMIEARRAEVGL